MTSRFARLYIAIILCALIASCDRTDDGVAGDSACRDFNEDAIEILREKSDLTSARSLRDMFIECDLTKKKFDEGLHWAKIAAELGNEEDKLAYQALLEASQRPSSTR